MRDDLDRLTVTIKTSSMRHVHRQRWLRPQPLDYGRLVERAIDLTRTRNQLPIEALRFEGPTSLGLRRSRAIETAVVEPPRQRGEVLEDNVRVVFGCGTTRAAVPISRWRIRGSG